MAVPRGATRKGAHLDAVIAVFSLSHDEGVGEGWGEGGPFRQNKQTGRAQRPLLSPSLSPTLSSISWRRESVVSDRWQCQEAPRERCRAGFPLPARGFFAILCCMGKRREAR